VGVSDLERTAEHGGPDGGPPIAIDFSTNAHPLGPNPWVQEEIRRADRSRYPDPEYTALREELARLHGASRGRIVVGASASELIWRVTRAWRARPRAAVVTDARTFGEYSRAAFHAGVPLIRREEARGSLPLVWHCCPDNPTGEITEQKIVETLEWLKGRRGAPGAVVVDFAYWPFRRLLGEPTGFIARRIWIDEVLQLWTPNKLHGLTGVRGAYLVLPRRTHATEAGALMRQAPSWVLGADGVALLSSHTRPESRRFLMRTAMKLRQWKASQDRYLRENGWQAKESPLHFGLWRPPPMRAAPATWHAQLRRKGIKVRDATSFGRPGWVRLVSRSPKDVEALITVTSRLRRGRAGRPPREAAR
jgi:histidinol-phosphate aminotransferase